MLRSTSLTCVLFAAACGTTDAREAAPSSAPRARPAPRSHEVEPVRTTRPVAAQPSVPARASTAARVRTETLSGLRFGGDNGDYPAVFRVVQAVTDIPIVLTPAAREVVEGEGLSLNLEVTAPITVANLLTHMTSQSDALAWRIRDDVVFVETRSEGVGDLRVAYYDVRDLTFARTEFIPPRIEGIPTGKEDGPRTGAEGEERFHAIDPDSIVDTIRIATDPTYWDTEPGASIELLESGTLIVRAGDRMHRQVRRVLGMM